jgi:hypothetical protein
MMQSNFLAIDFGHVHLASSRAQVLPPYHKQYLDIRDLHLVKPRSSHIVPGHFVSLQYLQQWNSMYGRTLKSPFTMELDDQKFVVQFPTWAVPRTISRAHPSISLFSGCYKPFFSGVKHLWHEADQPPPTTALQKDGATLPIPNTPMPSWFKCLITHRNSFTCGSWDIWNHFINQHSTSCNTNLQLHGCLRTSNHVLSRAVSVAH